MIKDLVSVIIPTYGGPEFLPRCIDSVLSQTYKNIEIIIVDDNGLNTPKQLETARVMENYNSCPNVKYICHEVNRNGSAARNTGVKASNGEYIALLDDDDEYVSTKIENLLVVLKNLSEEYALVYGNALGYDEEELIYDNKANVPEETLYNILMHRFSIGTSAFLMRATAYNNIGGFDESFIRHQDWEFFCKIIAQYKIKAVDIPASIRHLTRRNSPKNVDAAVAYRLHYLTKMQPYIELLPIHQQKDVVIYNKLEVIFKYLSERNYRKFWRQYSNLHPGLRGLRFIIRRIITIIKRGSIRGKQ